LGGAEIREIHSVPPVSGGFQGLECVMRRGWVAPRDGGFRAFR
jgi:hypothetical protein